MTTKQTDFTNVTLELRDIATQFTQVEDAIEDAYEFYVANQGDTWWTALASDAEVPETGITKAQFVAMMTFYLNLVDFLGNVAVPAADRRATIEQVRATS